MKKFTFTISRSWLPILAVLALAFVFSQFSVEANAITVSTESAAECCAPCDPADCPMPCPPGCCVEGASSGTVQAVAASGSGCETSCVKTASVGCTPCPIGCEREAGSVKTSEVAQLN